MKKFLKYFLVFGFLIALSIVCINIYILEYSQNFIFSEIDSIDNKSVGLVLGASVLPNGKPSGILQDRLDSAYDLYKVGKIQNILVSGDNSTEDYNESDNMALYLINKGIPEGAVYRDYAGFDTYDSMYRAEYIFGVTDMIIFTQEYHLSRSIYIARRLGINATGFISDKYTYLGMPRYQIREVFSRVKAFFDVEILNSKPKFLGERIVISI